MFPPDLAGAWRILGLDAPPADAGALRAAYARRLKAIDIDADPHAFIALREAFTLALDALTRPISPPEPRAAQPAQEPPSPSPVADDVQALSTQTAFDALYSRAVSQSEFGQLLRLYREGLAKGLIPLGQEHSRLADVVRLALDDATLRPSDLADLATLCRLDGDVGSNLPDALERGLRGRLDAEAWWERQIRLARAWVPIREPFPSRGARFIVGRWAAWRLMGGDAPWVQALIDAYRRHGPHLGPRFDADRAAKLKRRIDWVLNPGTIRRWSWWGVLALMMVYALAMIVLRRS